MVQRHNFDQNINQNQIKKKRRKESNNTHYRKFYSIQPTELCTVCTYLLSHTRKNKSQVEYNFQIWIIISISVCLFFRFDECCNLKMMDFEQEVSTLTKNWIDNLAIWVKDKTYCKRNLLLILGNREFFYLGTLLAIMICTRKKGLTCSVHFFPQRNGAQFCEKAFAKEVKFFNIIFLKMETWCKRNWEKNPWTKNPYHA